MNWVWYSYRLVRGLSYCCLNVTVIPTTIIPRDPQDTYIYRVKKQPRNKQNKKKKNMKRKAIFRKIYIHFLFPLLSWLLLFYRSLLSMNELWFSDLAELYTKNQKDQVRICLCYFSFVYTVEHYIVNIKSILWFMHLFISFCRYFHVIARCRLCELCGLENSFLWHSTPGGRLIRDA